MQAAEIGFAVTRDGLADRDRLDLRVALQRVIKAAQKFTARLR